MTKLTAIKTEQEYIPYPKIVSDFASIQIEKNINLIRIKFLHLVKWFMN